MLLAYAEDDMAAMVKTAMGWNFASGRLGEQITKDVVDLVVAGKVKPVVGRTVPFSELPGAVAAMANRETTGRTIVMVDGS